jgi:hypothetical protein
MPREVVQLRSALGVAEIARIFQEALGGRRVEFGRIDDSENPFAALEARPAFSVVASRDKNIGSWAVQLYVYDEGAARTAEVHAVYHSGFSRAMAGARNTYSRSAGVKKAQFFVDSLQGVDSLSVIL